ncbi:hypothetical protein MJH12_13210, partial [bacterium]|nr:hypothetical protein [bacterium]
IKLEFDGAKNQLLRLSADFDIDLYGFFTVNGGFSFEKSSANLTLSDGSTSDVNMVTLGGSGVNAFAGINGGSADAIGLNLTGVNLGIAIATSKQDSSEKWVTLKADASSVAFVGVDKLTIEATAVSVEVNLKSKSGKVIDYKTSSFDVSTSSDSTIKLDLDGQKGQMVQVGGHVTLNVFDFFTVDGDFTFSKTTQDVTLSDGSEANVDLLSIGGANISAFAGMNASDPDRIGFSLSDTDFAMSLMTDTANKKRKWLALKADVGNAAFVGIDAISFLEINDIGVHIERYIGQSGASRNEVSASGSSSVSGSTSDALKKFNTTLRVDLNDTFGIITLQKSGDNSTFTVTQSESDLNVANKLKLALEQLNGIGAGNVQVSGTKLDGFTVEFNNALAGSNVSNIDISVQGFTWNAGVQQVDAHKLGTNEIQTLRVKHGSSIIGGQIYLEFDGYKSRPVYMGHNLAQNLSLMNIALKNHPLIGSDNVEVTLDSSSTIFDQIYNISFKGKLANQELNIITPDARGVQGAVVTISKKVVGKSISGETQRISISTSDDANARGSGTFKLSLDLDGNTYKTGTIDMSASALDVELVLNKLFKDINGTVSVSSNAIGTWDIKFSGVFDGKDLNNLSLDFSDNVQLVNVFVTSVGKTISQADLELSKKVDNVVNLSENNVTIDVGQNQSVSLDMKGDKGNLMGIDAPVKFNLGDFLVVDGTIAIEKFERIMTLPDGSSQVVDVMTFGAGNLTAFAGINGGQDNAVGLDLTDVNFGLSISKEQIGSRVWTSAKAEIGSIAFVGLDALTLQATNTVVEINLKASDGTVLTYEGSELEIATGSDSSVTIANMGTSQLLRVSIGQALMKLGDFIHVSGGLFFEKSSGTIVNVKTGLPVDLNGDSKLSGIKADLNQLKTDGLLSADNSTITGLSVSTLTLGAGNVDIFVGLDPYFIDSNNDGVIDDLDTPDQSAFGLGVEDIDLGLVIMKSLKADDPKSIIPTFFALQAKWPDPLDLDLGFFELDLDDLEIRANMAGKWKNTAYRPFVDFKTSFENGYIIPAPSSTSGNITLEYDRGMIGASLGNARLSIEDAITIQGSIGFELGFGMSANIVTGLPPTLAANTSFKLKDGLAKLKTDGFLSQDNSLLSNVPMNSITLGGDNIDIFLGDEQNPLIQYTGVSFGMSVFSLD